VAVAALIAVAGLGWLLTGERTAGMDMGPGTDLGSLGFYVSVWVAMMAAMMLPGTAPAVLRRARTSGRSITVPLFLASYLAIWTLAGVAVFALYRPHGTLAAGAVTIGAGLYELTPPKRHLRRCCRESDGPGFEYGLYCVGSSVGPMLMLWRWVS
jgi:predicted metal-binding membrane protein